MQTKPFQSLTEAVNSSDKIDGIIVSTPTFTHETLIKESANYGLSIFTEKPVDETAAKIESLFDYCDTKGSKLCCSFQRRFDTSYVATREALTNGAIGKPLTARIFFGDHPCPPPEFLLSGGDIFMDLSAHDVDYIRWCLNDEIESVYATGTSSNKMLEDAGVYDNATLLLNFRNGKNSINRYNLHTFRSSSEIVSLIFTICCDVLNSPGAVVTIFMSRSASYGYDQRCEIFGDGGLLQVRKILHPNCRYVYVWTLNFIFLLFCLKNQVENEHCHQSTLSNQGGVHLANLKYSFPQRFKQAYESELDAFADTLLYDSVWPVSAKDCIAVQRVSDAARLSCELNQVVMVDSMDEIDVEPAVASSAM